MKKNASRAALGAVLTAAAAALAPSAHAQSNVGELLEKGGQQVSKADWLALVPMRIEQQWPNRQGEEELSLSADGKISGKGYHYSSRSESPATGSWRVEDDGKICAPKTFTAWNNSTNNCWYFFKLEDAYYGAPSLEPSARVGRVKSVTRIAAAQ